MTIKQSSCSFVFEKPVLQVIFRRWHSGIPRPCAGVSLQDFVGKSEEFGAF